MWHTLAQAIQLTGRSRRSLYRDMDAGRVSYRVRDDGRRELETSELIRAYGHLKGLARETVPEVAQVGTGDGTPTAGQFKALLEELKLLRDEVRELRETLLLIEHKPVKAGNPAPDEKKFERPKETAKNFADLLKALPE
ncbi:hypothetical protein D3C78_1047710 [compost metagenome]